MEQRLDKLLCSQSEISRADAGRLIRTGRVTVGGKPCRDPARKLDPAAQPVAVDGKPVGYAEHLYLMLNKPAGILCVSRDPKAPTVIDLVPPEYRRRGLFPAGRLDKDTRGLTLITDDGVLAHEILSPRHHIPKTYLAVLDRLPDEASLDRLRAGITLESGAVFRPAEITVADAATRTVEVILHEGQYHEIKRMFAAVGCPVIGLRRIAMGSLLLDESLPEGQCRPLTEQEKIGILSEKSSKKR